MKEYDQVACMSQGSCGISPRACSSPANAGAVLQRAGSHSESYWYGGQHILPRWGPSPQHSDTASCYLTGFTVGLSHYFWGKEHKTGLA